jgi:anhydro-N-acetylmuramic acid kinase
MPEILRFESAAVRPQRWIAGLLVSNDCSRISAGLVIAAGRGLAVEPHLGPSITIHSPREVVELFAPLADAKTRTPAAAPELLADLRSHLADAEASLLSTLMAEAQIPPARLLAVGAQDPGLWSCGRAAGGGYLGLCDAARLAELTGLNVIDAFAARDVARGGQGGPLSPLAEWVLFRDSRRNRLLVDLGRTTRMTWLPRGQPGISAPKLLSFDVGPGMWLLDLLAQRLSGGEHAYDPGGRMAVQGRRIGELMERWLADPYFRRSLPRWRPYGVRPERFLLEAVHMAIDAGWSVRDMLCTATHFIAEAIDLAIRRRLPGDAAIDEMIVTGGGQHNGMLLREIAARLPNVPLIRTAELNVPAEALGPACVALLALFHIDQVPANSAEVTGTDVARVLGRLTPGSPQAWQRLLTEMAGSRPAVRSLRSAL